MQSINSANDSRALSEVDEFAAMQARKELLEDINKAESQINEGRGVPHQEGKAIVMKSCVSVIPPL